VGKSGLQLEGDKALAKVFKTLGPKVQRRVLRSAVNAATTPVTKAAKAKADASKQSGLLKKALGKKTKSYSKSMTVVGIVGARTNVIGEYKGKKRWPAKYSHLVEKGHIARDGSFVPPKPFLQPAMDETKAQAVNVMKDKLASGVAKEATAAKGRAA
jgi:HK97 gp10 family phage protein